MGIVTTLKVEKKGKNEIMLWERVFGQMLDYFNDVLHDLWNNVKIMEASCTTAAWLPVDGEVKKNNTT